VLFTIRIVEGLAALPHGGIALGRLALPLVVCFYACLLGWTYIRARLPAVRASLARRARPSLALSTLGLAALLVWRLALNAPDGHLHLIVMDVGAGEAVLVQTPSGRSLLINGGASETRLSDGLGRRLPLGQRRLDWVIVAATGSDSLAALPAVLERFPPDSVLWGGAPAPNSAAARLRRYLVGKEIALLPLQTGQVLDLGQGAELHVLSASRSGSVLLLRWGAFQAVLPFGRDGEALEKLAPSIPSPTTALLLADGGSAVANPPGWITALQPQLVLASLDAGDRRGLPSQSTLEAVVHYLLLRTDHNGWIHLHTDGERLWIETEK
jgi:competence protein ComEC